MSGAFLLLSVAIIVVMCVNGYEDGVIHCGCERQNASKKKKNQDKDTESVLLNDHVSDLI